ncbi:MAG: hypothetical protein LBP55_07040 [Candidatus Adiutrix sp.]|jgi:hypothetical protein|nr:hypothetical protein [Candidatus Adiutrix sp.]
MSLILGGLLLAAGPAAAQLPESQGGALAMTGSQKRTLLLIAREAVEASRAGRPSREPTNLDRRLTLAQPLIISIYLDGRLWTRAWQLKNASPLYLAARGLTYEALAHPKIGGRPLTPEELGRVQIGLDVLSGYAQAKDETEVPPRSAVIIYSGFTEWLALPGDVKSDQAADLLTYACQQAGLRPNAWLLPQETTIFSAQVDTAREGFGGGK